MKLSRTRLRAARKAANLSQPKLAAAAGVNLGSLRQFEQGRSNGLKAESVYAIARVLEVPMEALFADEATALNGSQA
jgi:transcriptional regulator with XRE-family HTH domain